MIRERSPPLASGGSCQARMGGAAGRYSMNESEQKETSLMTPVAKRKLDIPRWKAGMPPDVDLQRAGWVGHFIKTNKLEAIDGARLPAKAGKNRTAARERLSGEWLDPRGGGHIAHLHYQGKVFQLTSKQWQDFSRKLVKVLGDKLAEAKKIEFEQAMDLSTMINGLA